ncbi:hypothetical protein [Pseudomonas sp. 34 E 7]|nr:hypothetical protein [Pseudomonas sp. 34 E 7]
MWTAGSPRNELGQPTDRCADPAAVTDRSADADARRETPPAQSQDQSVLQHHRPGHRRIAAVLDTTRRPRLDRRVPAGQLASAVRYRAGGGSTVGADAGADRDHRRQRAVVRDGPLGPCRHQFPCAVPGADDGPVRCLPHRRPVQSVRVLRGVAGGLLRPDAARFRPRPSVVGAALHRDQPAGVVAVFDWRGDDLWGDRHAELR